MSTTTELAPQEMGYISPNSAAFELAQRQAKALASSDLVPQQYRGNMANTLLALEIANRIGATPFAVMQNLYIVQGRPSWSSSFLIATVNACGRFEPLRFETKGDDPSAKSYRVRAYAKDKASGEVCYGAWITWAMVDAEGWSKKSGSKWLTMPEQMFMYRAAGFWSRVYAPEISLGILTVEEASDIVVDAHVQTQPGAVRAGMAQLKERIGALPVLTADVVVDAGGEAEDAKPPAEAPAAADVVIDPVALLHRAERAKDGDELSEIVDAARGFSASDKRRIREACDARMEQLREEGNA